MAVELDHRFSTSKSIDDSFAAITDLERVVPFTGTVEVAEQDADAHRALLRVKSKEAGGQGHANADVAFQLEDGGGTIHTKAQITGKAASMGEGVVIGVLDGLITDFTGKLGEL